MAPQTAVRILVVDNEPAIISGLRRLLSRDGYTVETAQNGHQALALLLEHPYDLILCDMRMPELDGPAFYGRLLLHYPSLCRRVLFLTGDTSSAESRLFLERCGQPWIAKPYSATEIRRAVVQMLNTPVKDASENLEEYGPGTEGVV